MKAISSVWVVFAAVVWAVLFFALPTLANSELIDKTNATSLIPSEGSSVIYLARHGGGGNGGSDGGQGNDDSGSDQGQNGDADHDGAQSGDQDGDQDRDRDRVQDRLQDQDCDHGGDCDQDQLRDRDRDRIHAPEILPIRKQSQVRHQGFFPLQG